MTNTTATTTTTKNIYEKYLESDKSKSKNKLTRSRFIDELNKAEKCAAVLSVLDGNNIKWTTLFEEVKYDYLTEDGEPKSRLLKAVDVACMKASKNSYKVVPENTLLDLVSVFGSNLSKEYHAKDGSLIKVKVWAKHITDKSLNCFICDTADSINNLEKSLQVIADMLLGENAVKVKKSYVRHLSDTFTRATAKGYTNGNEIALLDLIINHLRDCRNNVTYELNGKLATQKEPNSKK